MFQLSVAGDGDAPPESADDQLVRERNQTSRLAAAELKRWSLTSKDDRTEWGCICTFRNCDGSPSRTRADC